MTLLRMHAIVFPLLVGLGILTFSVAEQNLMFVVIAVPVIIASQLINGGANPTPLPRWVINLLVVVATLYLAVRWGGNFDEIISVVCQYLILLQLLKMFEPLRPRDQAQTIMLSVMLVIGSTLTSVTAELGLVLLVYLPVLLWTILLHQLASGLASVTGSSLATGSVAPIVVGRRPKGDLLRVAVFAGVLMIVGAAGVFVAMPRGMMGQGSMMGQWGNPANTPSVTGFTTQVKLGSSGLLTESTRIVFEARVESDDGAELLGGRRLFRGAVLDFYDRERGEWRSNVPVQRNALRMAVGSASSRAAVTRGETVGHLPEGNTVTYTQRITMRVPVLRNIFAMWKPQTFRLDSGNKRIQLQDDLYRGTYTTTMRPANLEYTVVSTPHALTPPRRYSFDWFDQSEADWRTWLQSVRGLHGPPVQWEIVFRMVPPDLLSSSKPAIEPSRAANSFTNTGVQELAERILAQRRIDVDQPGRDTYDAAASAFKLYLQDNFTYTTEMVAPDPGQDPIEMFLFDEELGGRGHCEYFASALAAMCMSVGIPARVVTGYVASETDGAGRFIVRENHAHAWVEVEIRAGRWQEFDPSPPEEVQRLHSGGPGLMAGVRRIFEVFQLAWIRNIVTYDRERQAEALDEERSGPVQILRAANRWVGAQLLDQSDLTAGVDSGSALSATARTFISVLMLSAFLGTGLFLVMSRGPLVLRRALAFMTLSAPPDDAGSAELRAIRDQHRRMNRALGRIGLGRDEFTPALSHARSIESAHPEVAAGSVRVTDIYYGARFGNHALDDETVEDVKLSVRGIIQRCERFARSDANGHNGRHARTNGSRTG